jgi:hypothetical protein
MSDQIVSPDDQLRYELLKELEKIQKENDDLKKGIKSSNLTLEEQLAESRKFPPKNAGMTPNEQLIEYKKFGRPIQFPQFYLHLFGQYGSIEQFRTYYNNKREYNCIHILIYDILWQIMHNVNTYCIHWPNDIMNCPFNIDTIKNQITEIFPSLDNLQITVSYSSSGGTPISIDIKWDPIRQI